jgi:predicted transcriptional regulator
MDRDVLAFAHASEGPVPAREIAANFLDCAHTAVHRALGGLHLVGGIQRVAKGVYVAAKPAPTPTRAAEALALFAGGRATRKVDVADRLGVNRGVAIRAVDRLISDGLLVALPGGFYGSGKRARGGETTDIPRRAFSLLTPTNISRKEFFAAAIHYPSSSARRLSTAA